MNTQNMSLETEIEMEMMKYQGLSHKTMMALIDAQARNMMKQVPSMNSEQELKSMLLLISAVIRYHDGKVELEDLEIAKFVAGLFGAKPKIIGETDTVVDIWEE